ncbi:Ig-like domain-containing protein [Patescibacteria group bacterium]|nr:Ig-like domain-containing protein [Patescibacteria group bacterium]
MKTFNLFPRKNITKTIVAFVVLLVLTLIFVSTVGLKLLLNYSVFMANVFSKKTPAPLPQPTDVYGSVNIDDIPSATNSAQISVSGSVINYDIIQFFVNDVKVKTLDSFSSDSFSQTIGDLQEGSNQVYIKALTKDGKNSKSSDTFNVILKTTPPKLDISEPQDKSTTSNQDLNVKGATDKEVFVKVNDLPITVDVDGSFQTSVRLKDGDNTITVSATDVAGNVVTKTLTVTYQKEN